MKKRILKLTVLAVFLLTGTGLCHAEEETRIFTDSAGRQVEVPAQIRSIIPSGNMAQMFLWPLASDRLASVAQPLTKEQEIYLGDSTEGLPETGNLYMTGSQLNIEEVASVKPDIIIDFGEAKETIAEDLDNLQNLLGIPCVFIGGGLESSADSYRMLGELLGMEEEEGELAAYIETVTDTVQEVFKTADKKECVVLNGTDGLGCVASGTYFDEIWAYMMKNAAQTDGAQMYAATTIDLEQLANWDPEYLFFYNSQDPEEIIEESVWKELTAVKNGNYYEVPGLPYSFVSPPTVNRYLAAVWIAGIVYPDEFEWDTEEMIKEYYRLFYHYDLSDREYEEIISGAES